jgi:hypothetical protein
MLLKQPKTWNYPFCRVIGAPPFTRYYQEELFVRGKDGLLPTAKAIEIYQNFRQVMELVESTFIPTKR